MPNPKVIYSLMLFLAFASGAAANDAPLRVVTDNNYPPYVFVSDDGEVQGYVVDLWRLWEKKTGRTVTFRAIQWAEAQRALVEGEADVIDMLFRTPAREQLYQYSPPYADLPVSIYVEESIHGINDVQDLRGFEIGVQRGDACIDTLSASGVSKLRPYDDYEAILKASHAGEIRMFCMDEAPANYYLYLFRHDVHFAKAFTLYTGQFHWAVAAGDIDTFVAVSEGMARITPEERESLREKWFSEPVQFQPWLRGIAIATVFASLIAALSLFWVRLLRRQVESRTREVRATNQQLGSTLMTLKSEKARLRTIIESSPDAIALKDQAGVYLDCNEVFAEWAGLQRTDVLGKSADQISSDRSFIESVHQSDALVLENATSTRTQEELAGPDGSIRVLEVIKVPVRDGEQEVTGILAVARDVTTRVQAERELRIAAAALEGHDGIMITNADGVIERVNSSFTRLTGYAPDDVVGQTPRLLQSGLQSDDFYRQMRESLDRDGYWSGEVVDRRRDGSMFPARLKISSVKDGSGRPLHYVGHLEDLSEVRAAEDLADHLRWFDALTDLPNRSMLRIRLHQAIASMHEPGRHGALLMFNLDHFSRINDSLGHDVGDRVIVEVARRASTIASPKDWLFRFSADTFVMLSEDSSLDPSEAASRAAEFAERLRLAVATPTVVDGQSLACTCSVGVTLFFDPLCAPDALLQQAELAMFRSKDLGRDRTSFFEPGMQEAFDRRNRLEMALKEAIDGNQLQLYFQVQVDDGRRPIGAEALIRWQHPSRGMIPPSEFIPVAESSGLIDPIGRWVLRSAVEKLADWAVDDSLAALTLAVNVSAGQFSAPDFVDNMLDLVQRSGVAPSRLKIEVTESLAISDPGPCITKLERLRALGFAISIDDFGTGNSSLVYLTELPVSQLKIDKSFVDDLPENPKDAMVAQTVIALGRGLDLQVIAEGVETETQFDFLVKIGCDAFQGYLFGRPMPAADFEASIRSMRAMGTPP